MEIVKKPLDVSTRVGSARLNGRTIGFVPTMGALHEGHASLVRMARNQTDYVVVSIFVNPKQFGPGEDFNRYPRNIEKDSELLRKLGCDLLFTPSPEDVYSPGERTRVLVRGMTETLCGRFRPGHFDGVALVVAKLFNIVRPDKAFFGQKDAQQAVIVQRMTYDLDFPVRIVLGPIVREKDGLAMSSRNVYLSADERKRAVALFEALSRAKELIVSGERRVEPIRDEMLAIMKGAEINVDYAEIVEGATLTPVKAVEGKILIAVAGRLGATRLIDNFALEVNDGSVKDILLEFPEWSRYGWP